MTAICSIEECGKPQPKKRRRGWCHMHYMRWYRHGDPLGSTPRRSAEQRFWPKVNKDGPPSPHRPDLGPCWLWTAGTAGLGYGYFFPRHGHPVYAHRFAYVLLVGPIPEGYEIDHLCRIPTCVKAIANEQGPAHLEPVTPQENQRRQKAALATTHCLYGHPKDGISRGRPYCKTCNREKARRLRELRYLGRGRQVLAQLPNPLDPQPTRRTQ